MIQNVVKLLDIARKHYNSSGVAAQQDCLVFQAYKFGRCRNGKYPRRYWRIIFEGALGKTSFGGA